MSEPDLVMHSFEIAAESGEDINQRVYDTFIARSPQSGELMDHMDEHMLGRMMVEVLTVLMAEDVGTQREYLNFEIGSHRAYGVVQTMYRELLMAVRDSLRVLLGPNWNSDYESAWDERISLLVNEIDEAAVAAG